MTLTFPTQAEQCRDAFLAHGGSISKIARKMNAQREDEWLKRIFVFEDDTRLIATGTGRSLTITCELP